MSYSPAPTQTRIESPLKVSRHKEASFIKYISKDQNIGKSVTENISQSIPQSSKHQCYICITVVVRAVKSRSMN